MFMHLKNKKSFNNLFNKYIKRDAGNTEVNKTTEMSTPMELTFQCKGERQVNNISTHALVFNGRGVELWRITEL